jgi:hypothetical protein
VRIDTVFPLQGLCHGLGWNARIAARLPPLLWLACPSEYLERSVAPYWLDAPSLVLVLRTDL